ncbi:hypothetical protein [Noviherbaspirillum aerium]|uniref:hypothetical protein n=1 Tax=Noviherbaspirillum aerium TaxID=2588497 RepID=UPI00124C7782|nr:hypothetical protein [Noviherbaspirillum aerium]
MSANPPLIDPQHADFLQSGVSLSVGACDNQRMPTLARATGCRLSPDRRQVTIFISATQGAPVLRCVRENGAITVVFSRPSTHRTVQIKGKDAVVGGLLAGDLDIVERYRSSFARELDPLGFDEILIRTLLAAPPADLVAVTFTPLEAYSQTPGPNAGEPLKAQA